MSPLAPVVRELRMSAVALVALALLPILLVAGQGAGGLVVASILVVAGGIYFAVVARLQRERVLGRLAAAPEAEPDAPLEPPSRALARTALDVVVAAAVSALASLAGVGSVAIAVVLGVGAYRAWEAVQVRGWERTHGRVLLRAPSVTRTPLAPEHLAQRPLELNSTLAVVAAPLEVRDPPA